VILIWQNDQLPPHEQFIISDLDSRHLLVKTSEVESIEEQLNLEVRTWLLELPAYQPSLVFMSICGSGVCIPCAVPQNDSSLLVLDVARLTVPLRGRFVSQLEKNHYSPDHHAQE
jgi:hypothetical protein